MTTPAPEQKTSLNPLQRMRRERRLATLFVLVFVVVAACVTVTLKLVPHDVDSAPTEISGEIAQ